jgi:arginase family enzyme
MTDRKAPVQPTEPVTAGGQRETRTAAGFWVVAVTLGLFLAAASAPSPLYGVYAARWHFSSTTLTAVFAVYAVALLATLLIAGSLSDSIGRRPVIAAGLALQVVSMGLFLAADGTGWLYGARIVQGVATGLVTAAVAASLLDLQPAARPGLGGLVNAVTPTAGLAGGSILAGALVQYAPDPLRLTYLVLLIGFLALGGAMLIVPEPAAHRAAISLRPRAGVHPSARPAFWAALPCLVATWALGGLYLSLGPSLILNIEGSANHLLGGSIVFVLCTAGATASVLVRAAAPTRVMLAGCALLVAGLSITIVAIAAGSGALLFAASAISGAGFGAGFLGAFRQLVANAKPAWRAELIAAIYVVAYLAFALPAVVAGVITEHAGLRNTTTGYAVVVAILAVAAIVAHRVRAGGGQPPPWTGRAELIGVPFDGMGRAGGQAGAPHALRAAGFLAAFGAGARLGGDVDVPEPVPLRGSESGLLNEDALLAMIASLHTRVASCLSTGRFPVIYGGDCSVLLAALPALRARAGEAGLVFLDGHEDATPIELSDDGEAANMEIAMLLGTAGHEFPPPLRQWLPTLREDAVAILGPRDADHRARLGIPTIADRVWLRSAKEVRDHPRATARQAVRHVEASSAAWWLHTDLDVLDGSDYAACGDPGQSRPPGGLTWAQLSEVVTTALRSGSCAGWSIAVYNPDLDPGSHDAQRIVQFIAALTGTARRPS